MGNGVTGAGARAGGPRGEQRWGPGVRPPGKRASYHSWALSMCSSELEQRGPGTEGALACAKRHLRHKCFCPACQGMQQGSQMETRKLWEPAVTHPPSPPPPSPKAKEKLMRVKNQQLTPFRAALPGGTPSSRPSC